MADILIGPARIVRFDVANFLPTAVLPTELAPSDLMVPVLGYLDVAGHSIPVWVSRASDYLDKNSQPRSLPADEIGLSNSAWSALQQAVPTPDPVALLVIKAQHTVTVMGALASDLPRGSDVHVSADVASELGLRRIRLSQECLLSTGTICAPVRAVRRRTNNNVQMRAGMLTRALFELQAGDTVQLSLIPRASKQLKQSLSSRAMSGPPPRSAFAAPVIAWGGVKLLVRLADDLLEMMLRLLLRAPEQPVRVVQAHPGDDSSDRRVIRLHPTVFPSLGITPGMQVFVCWGKRRTIAIALDDYQPHSPDIPTFLRSRQTSGTRLDLPAEFPPHLVARVSMSVRRDLGMSSDTVAEVQRRLRTAVLSQLNQLIIPITGLLLAALAIQQFNGWKLYTGLVAVTILGLVPLRKPPPPRGRWP